MVVLAMVGMVMLELAIRELPIRELTMGELMMLKQPTQELKDGGGFEFAGRFEVAGGFEDAGGCENAGGCEKAGECEKVDGFEVAGDDFEECAGGHAMSEGEKRPCGRLPLRKKSGQPQRKRSRHLAG